MAAKKPAERAGRGSCPQCREPVTFKKSSGGLLRYACDACQTSGYAEPGGDGFRRWSATIKSEGAAAPAPAAPAAKAPAAAFDLAGLR